MGNNNYFIKCKLKTLLSNAVKDGNTNTSFELNGFKFRHSDFNYRDGWVDDYWIIEKQIKEEKYQDALISFYKDLDAIVDRIEFIGQAYCGYPFLSPTLVYRQNYVDDLTFFRYVREHKGNGLMFTSTQYNALDKLIGESSVPKSFYSYWAAATKTKDYSAKLMVMLAAIESLVRAEGKNNFTLRKKILGEDLDTVLFAQGTGLRHRLSHGEHLSNESADHDNLTDQIHKKVLMYFNTEIINEDLLSLNVVSPQRTEYGNFLAGNTFVRSVDGSNTDNIDAILDSLDGDLFKENSQFKFDYSEERKTY
jgi:hypothetical protein